MAEELIRERLMTARPEAAWWGEESGRASGTAAAMRGAVGDGLEWVVDPIDGTTNFFYDLPGWAVSIAARRGGESVAAAVHVPTLATTFTAARGEGPGLEDAHGRRALAASRRRRAIAGADRDRVRLRRRCAWRCRDRSSGRLWCHACATSGVPVRRPSTSAGWRPDASTATSSEASRRGISRRAALIAQEAGAVVSLRPSGTTVAAGRGHRPGARAAARRPRRLRRQVRVSRGGGALRGSGDHCRRRSARSA